MATSIKLDDNLTTRVKNLANTMHRSAHWVMREAIRCYVEREEKHEAYKQEALDAWKTYQTNGLHVTLEEADDWLSKLEDGQSVEAPKCHR